MGSWVDFGGLQNGGRIGGFWLAYEWLHRGWGCRGPVHWQWWLWFLVESFVVVVPDHATVVSRQLMLILWDRKASHGSFFLFFVCLFVLAGWFLVFRIWSSLINPYSIELGFGFIVVP